MPAFGFSCALEAALLKDFRNLVVYEMTLDVIANILNLQMDLHSGVVTEYQMSGGRLDIEVYWLQIMPLRNPDSWFTKKYDVFKLFE